MPNPESDLIKNIVSERLKHVDGLVKAQKIDEAVKEIDEIRKLDSKNPYALAYEERIKALQLMMKKEPPPPSVTPRTIEQPNNTLPRPQNELQPPQPRIEPPREVPSNRETYSAPPKIPINKVRDSSAEGSSGVQNKSKGKGSILLVDDDVLLVQALAEFLEENKYSTKSCNRAEEALEYLRENSPDLVLCDVNLETSTFGGFTLHEKMRKLDHLRDVPFIFLSGLNDSAIVLAGKELGADDYLTKPVEPDALLAVVKGKLKRYRQIKKNS